MLHAMSVSYVAVNILSALQRTLVLYQNMHSQDHDYLINGEFDSSFFCKIGFFAKFESVHPDREGYTSIDCRFSPFKPPYF